MSSFRRLGLRGGNFIGGYYGTRRDGKMSERKHPKFGYGEVIFKDPADLAAWQARGNTNTKPEGYYSYKDRPLSSWQQYIVANSKEMLKKMTPRERRTPGLLFRNLAVGYRAENPNAGMIAPSKYSFGSYAVYRPRKKSNKRRYAPFPQQPWETAFYERSRLGPAYTLPSGPSTLQEAMRSRSSKRAADEMD